MDAGELQRQRQSSYSPALASRSRAAAASDVTGVKYFFIGNVGTLVCPAVYDLGQAVNVVALSLTEGEDKPLKYPTMFAKADLVLLTKVDLALHLPRVNIGAIYDALGKVMPDPQVISIAAYETVGIRRWIDWLAQRRETFIAPQLVGEVPL